MKHTYDLWNKEDWITVIICNLVLFIMFSGFGYLASGFEGLICSIGISFTGFIFEVMLAYSEPGPPGM